MAVLSTSAPSLASQLVTQAEINLFTDEVNIITACGYVYMKVLRNKACTLEYRFSVQDGELVPFRPRILSIDERRRVVLQLREHTSLTQQQLAAFFEVGVPTIQRIIRYENEHRSTHKDL